LYVPDPVGWVDPFGLECKEAMLIDNQILIQASRGATKVDDISALEFLMDENIQAVITPSLFKEFAKIPHGGAPRRRFLHKIDAKVVTGDQAKAISEGETFNKVRTELQKVANNSVAGLGDRKRIVNGKEKKTHYVDIVHTASAGELEIPFVTEDKKYKSFVENQASGKSYNIKRKSDVESKN